MATPHRHPRTLSIMLGMLSMCVAACCLTGTAAAGAVGGSDYGSIRSVGGDVVVTPPNSSAGALQAPALRFGKPSGPGPSCTLRANKQTNACELEVAHTASGSTVHRTTTLQVAADVERPGALLPLTCLPWPWRCRRCGANWVS